MAGVIATNKVLKAGCTAMIFISMGKLTLPAIMMNNFILWEGRDNYMSLLLKSMLKSILKNNYYTP